MLEALKRHSLGDEKPRLSNKERNQSRIAQGRYSCTCETEKESRHRGGLQEDQGEEVKVIIWCFDVNLTDFSNKVIVNFIMFN